MPVRLRYEPVGVIEGLTRDVSLEGMYVETGGVRIPPNAHIEVRFETEHDGIRVEHRLPAVAIHGSNEGVGLMLHHIDYENFYALRRLITTDDSVTAARS
ncbi:MAG: PilZ domain-containing protein [Gammaproteobacteria bacterium]|nr:MAG: PilZ domain-containing protein [Gammaproteobacteria bacterium]